MKTNKKLILIVVATLSSLCSTSYALEESLALMFAVTAARSFIVTQPSIEVTSTGPVLLRGASALPLSDTQCMYTEIPEETPEETPEEQVCFGNNLPTRIELSPAAPLNIGFLPRATSQIEYRLLPVLVTDPVFSGTGVLPELNPAFAIATEIQQSAERQREIIEAARQRQQTFSSPFSPPFFPHSYNPHSYNKSYYRSRDKGYDKRLDGQGEQGIEANGQDFEWWLLGEPEPDMDDSDMATVRYDDIILIEPGSRYWFCSNVNDESQTHNQAVTDGESGSEDDSSSDEDNENEPEDEANPDSGVETTHTYTDPLLVYKEVDASAFVLKKLKIKCDSGDDVPAMLEKFKIKCDSGDDVPAMLEKFKIKCDSGDDVSAMFKKLKIKCDSGDDVLAILEKLKIKCDFGDDKPDPEKIVVKAEAGSTVCQPFNLPPVKKKKPIIPDLRKCLCHEARYPVSRICKIRVIGKGGQELPCGKICRNLQVLSNHQRRCHNVQ